MKTLYRPFRVNEAVVRGVAVQVFIIAATAVLTGNVFPVVFLVIDFFTRAVLTPGLSLTALISRKLIVPVAGFRKKLIMFKPKRFAAGIGLLMTVSATLFYLYGLDVLFTVFLAILVLFSFLEAFFRFCAGCKIFGLLIKLGIIDEDECTDCKFDGGAGI